MKSKNYKNNFSVVVLVVMVTVVNEWKLGKLNSTESK